ncbi:MAG: MMPL family transporter [Bacteroidales bacterium]|nr:MMPL family transporter [Bacteroidales bacterium]
MNQKIIKYRWWIIAASLLFTVGFSMSLLKLEIDPDLKNYFPKTMTSMVNTDRIEEVFGNQDIIMMIFGTDDILKEATLKRLKVVEKEIGRLEGIKQSSSLFGSNHIYGEEGVMYVEPTILRIPENETQREELRQTIQGNELVYKVMVSDDFKATALVLTLEADAGEDEVFEGIHGILQEHPGAENIYFGGLPYLRQAIDKDIKRDGLILIPIALLLMLIFLFLVFREWRGVWLPFLVVVMSALVGLSMIPVLGWKFYIITLLVPILLIAVANDYGIHMIARYQELNASGSGENMKRKAIRITSDLWKPITLTGLTTIAGISALWAHTMIPARQMALVASIGILLAIFFSLVLLPALLSLLPKSSFVPAISGKGRNGRKNLLRRFAFFVVRYKRPTPLLALAATLLISSGIFFLKVDSNEENFFPERHEVKKAAKIINSKFGGSESISLLFSGDMLSPELLQRMEGYGEEMKQLDAVDFTMGFSGVIKEISKALYDPGDPLYDQIPPTREAVAQYMELYSMNGDPGELEQLVDFNYEHAHLMIRINDTNNETINGVIERLKKLTEEDPAVEAIGGYGYVRTELANKVLKGTYYSLGIALIIIFILVSMIFRSLKAGLLGIVPLFISVLVLFGLMGLTGIRLDVATALLSSVMIGVGVDYSIHFLWRYREERRQNRPATEAVITTITTTGRGIIYNALSVIVGFVVLIISSFTPIRFFGVLVVVSILSCLTGALVILPAVVLRFRFRFLEPAFDEHLTHNMKGRKTMRRIAMGLLLALLVSISASAQDARELIKSSHDVVKVKSFEAVSTLSIEDSRGNQRVRKSSMASMSLADGTEKRIIKFVSPAEVRGTGILIFDYPEKSDDMWIYLPALRKTRRIVSKEKSKSFMGSEFTNANMTAPGLDDFRYTLLGKDLFRDKNCFMVESIPADAGREDEYGYSKSVSWIEENTYLVYKIQYFDFDGELFKSITNSEFRELDKEQGKYMVTGMKAVNHQNKRSSEMIMDQVSVTSTNPSYFTVAYLEKE